MVDALEFLNDALQKTFDEGVSEWTGDVLIATGLLAVAQEMRHDELKAEVERLKREAEQDHAFITALVMGEAPDNIAAMNESPHYESYWRAIGIIVNRDESEPSWESASELSQLSVDAFGDHHDDEQRDDDDGS